MKHILIAFLPFMLSKYILHASARTLRINFKRMQASQNTVKLLYSEHHMDRKICQLQGGIHYREFLIFSREKHV